MFKFKIILTALLFLQTIVFSQKLSKDFTVTTATPYQVIDAGSKEYISLDNGFAIMAKMGKGLVHIQKFDVNNMKEIARNTYKDLPPKAFFQDIIKLEDQIYYIFEAFDKKADNFKVYCREINTEDATFKEQVILFQSSRRVVNSPNTKGLTRVRSGFAGFSAGGNKFLVYKSFDESKVMISYRCYPVSKDDNVNYDEIGFFVFDNKMQKIWGKEVKMPYTEAQINNVAYSVSSTGEAIMLAANRQKKKYEVFIVNTSGELTAKELELSTDMLVKKLDIKENNKGDYICTGFYANGIEFTYNPFTGGGFIFNANGLVYFVLDKDGNLLTNKTFEFSEEFIKQNLSDRQKKAVAAREKKGKAGILDLHLTNFVVKDDGSVFVIGERQYARSEYYGPQKQTVYHFSNAIAIKVEPNGELAWMKKLPKNQSGTSGCGQMSIAYLEGKTADYVAYIDNPKNISLSPTAGVPAAHKDGAGGFLTTYKINHDTGELEKHTICDMNKIGKYRAYQFKTWRIFRVADGVFLMEIYIKGKKDTMVKFELN